MPATPTYQSKRGKHRWFLRPDGVPKKATVEVDGIEFRIANAKGALSVVPPSVHESGFRYRWLCGLSLDEVEPAELPADVVERLTTEAKPEPVRDAIANSTRNKVLFRLACAMRRHGATRDTVWRSAGWEQAER